MLEEHFWQDRKAAQQVIDALNMQRKVVEGFYSLEKQRDSVNETLEIIKDSFDQELFDIFDEEYRQFKKDFTEFEVLVLLTGPYDNHNAIVELHPGAGGTESQDWAQMLYRMYIRWAEKHNYKVTVLDYQDGDEAGLKSATILIQGTMAFGHLRSERGVHRLVRISPFDSSGRRHTSFCSVDVMPQFEEADDIVISDADLILETHRSSGAGGQHVNKTDSAVRLIHKPTGLVANCQIERSQHANKERALQMLKSKLYQRQLEEQQAKLSNIKGEQKSIEWGSQIRSYVFCPYTLVKDNRTQYEEVNVQNVLEGELDGFIYEYLRSNVA